MACLLIAAPSAEARFFSFQCHPNQDLQVDPIVSPGVYPSAHLHTFYGATNVTQNSTTASMEAGGTSCLKGTENNQRALTAAQDAENTAGMWLPALYVNGARHEAKYLADYWDSAGVPSGTVFTNMPEGMQLVAGDSHATSPPPEYEVYWNCSTGASPGIPASVTPPKTCPLGGPGLEAHIRLPTCWDGVGLKPSDVTYAGAPAFTVSAKNFPCPTGDKTFAQVALILHTGLYSSAGISFSSGAVATLHADYWQSWKSQSLLASLENYLRTGAFA